MVSRESRADAPLPAPFADEAPLPPMPRYCSASETPEAEEVVWRGELYPARRVGESVRCVVVSRDCGCCCCIGELVRWYCPTPLDDETG